MSSFRIQGSDGARAEVGANSKRLRTQASQIPMLTQKSWDDGTAFSINMRQFAIPAHVDVAPQFPGTPLEGYTVQMIANVHPDLTMCLMDSIWTSNGGIGPAGVQLDRTFTCKATPIPSLARPTANVSTEVICNALAMNAGAGTTGTDFAFQACWDDVANGLTFDAGVINPVLKTTEWQCTKGQSLIPSYGAFCIPPGGIAPGLAHIFDAPDLLTGEVIHCNMNVTAFFVDARNGQASRYL